MPLSEQERRILEEIEKNLYKEDPGFATSVRKDSPRMEDRRRVRMGAITFVVGLVVLGVFLWTGQLLIGVLAFGTMVFGVMTMAGSFFASLAPRRPTGPPISRRLSDKLKQVEEGLKRRYRE